MSLFLSIFISDELIQRIKDENDIVDVVSEYVRLKKTGRNYIGLCPFHTEKTPSFSVSREKEIFKCFGCGEAGNVLTFIMKIRNLSFSDSCEFLADRANIQVKDRKQGNTKAQEAKERLYKLNKVAARFYFDNLIKDNKVMKYLSDRGLENKTIANFGLGYSLAKWNTSYDFLRTKGFSEEEMLKIGLLSKSQKSSKYKTYDRFRNRVMFPVFDYKGKVIGFGGRVLDDSKPKYLNSPESIIFDKGNNMYGLNFAIKKNTTKYFVLVEGYMDCIALHQAGITSAIASLGTALTINQARLMKRYTDKIYIAYDADLAGKKATNRGLDILSEQGFDVKVIDFKGAKDPDEFIKAKGVAAFYAIMENAISLTRFKIDRVRDELYNKNDPKSVDKYVNAISEILISLNPIERNIYVKEISADIDVEEQAIYDLLNKKTGLINKKNQNMNIKLGLGVKLYKEQPSIRASRVLLRFLLDKKCVELIRTNIEDQNLLSDVHVGIYNKIIDNIDLDVNTLNNRLDAICQEIKEISELIHIREITEIYIEDVDQMEKYILDCVKELKKSKLEQKGKEIFNKIKKMEKDGMINESFEYAIELQKIEKSIKEL